MYLLLPKKYKKTIKCPRCTKKHYRDLKQCPHCAEFQDGPELEKFIQIHKEQMRANVTIGLYFVLASFFVLIVMSLLQ